MNLTFPIEELDIVPGQYLQKLVGTDDIWEVRAQFGGNIFFGSGSSGLWN
jgi:hypothetical protein